MRFCALVGIFSSCLLLVMLVTHYNVGRLADADHNGATIAEGFLQSSEGVLSGVISGRQGLPISCLHQFRVRLGKMNRIRASAGVELRDLESRRRLLMNEVSVYQANVGRLKADRERLQRRERLLVYQLERLRREKLEEMRRQVPLLQIPFQLLANSTPMRNVIGGSASTLFRSSDCNFHDCFDYSKCSVTSGMPIYVYATDSIYLRDVSSVIAQNSRLTDDPKVACLYLYIAPSPLPRNVTRHLEGLRFWSGDGRNHIIVLLSVRSPLVGDVHTGRAIIISPSFEKFRTNFDVVVPPISHKIENDWQLLPDIAPARRKYLLTFHGEPDERRGDLPKLSRLVRTLKELSRSLSSTSLVLSCAGARYGEPGEWSLCPSEEASLRNSTFSLILFPGQASTYLVQHRVYSALRNGAIPVLVGPTRLPFTELIHWRKAAVIIPEARLPEVELFLLTLDDAHILEMRRFGRYLWQTFLASYECITLSLLALLRRRLDIPDPEFAAQASPTITRSTRFHEHDIRETIELDDQLGPIEPPIASPSFRSNFSRIFDPFNVPGLHPFHRFPAHPFENPIPADSIFKGSGYGFRPIGEESGGDGKDFSKDLGGNFQREQFTVVMLTFERESVLVSSLSRLKGLPYVNKVLVVWNGPSPPSSDMRWPEIEAPIQVIKTEKNSLNNRFLPYSAIETDAILSVDDDALLRHDEIIFGFRVWRESRDRIVGFPGRHHSWQRKDQAWHYNSNHTCELSMILTGAAFFHRYYAYLYTYSMPSAIRQKVDQYTNCEDIALNFLVSHVTRKPPIKVTSRWTFRCPGCPKTSKALSADNEHFQERHKCINFFCQVYGYLPLLHTQFRVDSILFKTKIPHDKQKCFKYI